MLQGVDLRSVGGSDEVARAVRNQSEFDALFGLLSDKDRVVVMRAADAIEKITRSRAHLLQSHRQQIIQLMNTAGDKELKWHLAQLVPRIHPGKQVAIVWTILEQWLRNSAESRIVRVNALQALFELYRINPDLENPFRQALHFAEQQPVASLQARARKICRLMD